MWGLLLVALGLGLLLDRMDLFDMDELWHYWPLMLVLVGINRMIGSPSPRDFTSGVWSAFVGIWLFCVFEHLFDLTFRNSWPLFIIVTGITMVLEPIVARIKSRESNNEKP
jgi:hypothetical protein